MADDIIALQARIRIEAEQQQSALGDLVSWMGSIKKKDTKLAQQTRRTVDVPAASSPSGHAPSRPAAMPTSHSNPAPSSAEKATSAAAHTYDKGYKRWEKFDVDAALAEAEDSARPDGRGLASPAVATTSVVSPPTAAAGGATAGVTAAAHASASPLPARQPAVAVRQKGGVVHVKAGDSGLASAESELAKAAGNAAYKAGDYSAAAAAYGRALLGNPRSAVLFSNRAQCRLHARDYRAALEDASAALRCDPTHVKSWLRRAAARSALGQPAAAARDLEVVLALERGHREAAAELRKAREAARSCRKRALAEGAVPLPVVALEDAQAAALLQQRRGGQEGAAAPPDGDGGAPAADVPPAQAGDAGAVDDALAAALLTLIARADADAAAAEAAAESAPAASEAGGALRGGLAPDDAAALLLGAGPREIRVLLQQRPASAAASSAAAGAAGSMAGAAVKPPAVADGQSSSQLEPSAAAAPASADAARRSGARPLIQEVGAASPEQRTPVAGVVPATVLDAVAAPAATGRGHVDALSAPAPALVPAVGASTSGSGSARTRVAIIEDDGAEQEAAGRSASHGDAGGSLKAAASPEPPATAPSTPAGPVRVDRAPARGALDATVSALASPASQSAATARASAPSGQSPAAPPAPQLPLLLRAPARSAFEFERCWRSLSHRDAALQAAQRAFFLLFSMLQPGGAALPSGGLPTATPACDALAAAGPSGQALLATDASAAPAGLGAPAASAEADGPLRRALAASAAWPRGLFKSYLDPDLLMELAAALAAALDLPAPAAAAAGGSGASGGAGGSGEQQVGRVLCCLPTFPCLSAGAAADNATATEPATLPATSAAVTHRLAVEVALRCVLVLQGLACSPRLSVTVSMLGSSDREQLLSVGAAAAGLLPPALAGLLTRVLGLSVPARAAAAAKSESGEPIEPACAHLADALAAMFGL
jgi:tetratricopeptide (TPR) repeat protein